MTAGLRRSGLARAARWPLASVPWARKALLWWWQFRGAPVRAEGLPLALDDAKAEAFTDITRDWDRASRRRARRHERAMAAHWARTEADR